MKTRRKTVSRRRRLRGGAGFGSFKSIASKFKKPSAPTAEPIAEQPESLNPENFAEIKQSEMKGPSKIKQFFSGKSPLSNKSSIDGEVETVPEPEPEPEPQNSVNPKNLSNVNNAKPLLTAAGVNNRPPPPKRPGNEGYTGPVPLPNNSNDKNEKKNEVSATQSPNSNDPVKQKNAKSEENSKKENVPQKVAAKPCNCSSCIAQEEAKKNCSWIRKKLYLCNNSNTDVNTAANTPNTKQSKNTSTSNTKKNSTGSKPASTSTPTPTPENIQRLSGPVSYTDLTGIMGWLTSIQAPINYSRVFNQIVYLVSNPAQLPPWAYFINHLKEIQGKTPEQQKAELDTLNKQVWGPGGTPMNTQKVEPSAPPAEPSARPAPSAPLMDGGRRRKRSSRRNKTKRRRSK